MKYFEEKILIDISDNENINKLFDDFIEYDKDMKPLYNLYRQITKKDIKDDNIDRGSEVFQYILHHTEYQYEFPTKIKGKMIYPFPEDDLKNFLNT